MKKHFGKMRTDVIPNPVAPSPSHGQDENAHLSAKSIVAVGRLHQQKGFDVLIEAFSKCVRKHPGWRLVIFGEGPEREMLESLVSRLGLEGKVSLPGRVRNPERVIGAAEIFVLSSRYEGFPNALLEAMTCGLPVIATDCHSGPAEIIRDGEDGLLVPVEDSGTISGVLIRLMDDPDERNRLGGNARTSVERFSLPNVMEKWEDLIRRVVLN